MREDVYPRAHRAARACVSTSTCRCSHGFSRILKAMRRTYDRARYLDRVAMIREHLPDAALTTDIIVGFPGETDADFSRDAPRWSSRSATTARSRSSSRRGAAPMRPSINEGSRCLIRSRSRRMQGAGRARPTQRARARSALRRAYARCARGRYLAQRPRAPAWPHPSQQGRELQTVCPAPASWSTSRSSARRARRCPARSACWRGHVRERARGRQMKMRAAVLEEFAKPLVVQEVELAEPGPARGARAPGRLWRVPHRHVHRLRESPPPGYAPTVLRRRRRGALRRGCLAGCARATTS